MSTYLAQTRHNVGMPPLPRGPPACPGKSTRCHSWCAAMRQERESVAGAEIGKAGRDSFHLNATPSCYCVFLQEDLCRL